MTGEQVLCLCPAFKLWYRDVDGYVWIHVCECGHLAGDHIDGAKACTGESLWFKSTTIDQLGKR